MITIAQAMHHQPSPDNTGPNILQLTGYSIDTDVIIYSHSSYL
jgi:hypothetical protein